MKKIRHFFYERLVSNNTSIKVEYEGNKALYPEEFEKNYVKYWIWLIGLNIKYRFLRIKSLVNQSSYNLKDIGVTSQLCQNSRVMRGATLISESKRYPVYKEVHMVKRFLEYEYVAFNVFDTLLFHSVDNIDIVYGKVGEKLGIPSFVQVRKKSESEISRKVFREGRKVNIFDIYCEISKYIDIDCRKGVELEVEILKDYITPNKYMKTFYEMLSYSKPNLVMMEDTVYSSEHIEMLLKENGFKVFKSIYVSSEKNVEISDGSMFGMIEKDLGTSSIIYVDDASQNVTQAKNRGWYVWDYYNVNERGKDFRVKELDGLVGSAYRSLINQHLYCGHFQHSIKRELGYIYFGILTLGFVKWIDDKRKKDNFSKFIFITGTSTILQKLYSIISDDTNSDVLYFSEEIAVRCLLEIDIYSFIDYYINRKIGGNHNVAYYIDSMGINELVGDLYYYGISNTDIVKKNSDVYWCFLDFIRDNVKNIKNIYEPETKAVISYLKSLKLNNSTIGIITIKGSGYISRALNFLLNKMGEDNYKVVELSMFQILDSKEYLYLNKDIHSFLYSKQNNLYGLHLPISLADIMWIESIFSDKAPRLRTILLDQNDNYIFKYSEAFPWKYDAVNEVQEGILDFFDEYLERWLTNDDMMDIKPEEVAVILKEMFIYKEYIKKNIPIIPI